MSDILDKINIVMSDVDNKLIDFDGNQIIIRPYLTMTDKIVLITEYIENIYDDSKKDIATKYITAEMALMLHIIDFCTNINTDNLAINLIIANKLWHTIKINILGYDEFIEDLKNVIEMVDKKNSLDKSVGNVLDMATSKVINYINGLPSIDADSIKKTSNEFTHQLSELNNKIPGILKNRRGRPSSKVKAK